MRPGRAVSVAVGSSRSLRILAPAVRTANWTVIVPPPNVTRMDNPLIPAKAELISRALARYRDVRSIIDAGACWGVNGGYTFHALQSGQIEQAFILDGVITPLTRTRAACHPGVELLEGKIGEPEFLARLPKCDAVIMFDVLLHQTKPDWRAFLAGYADKADHFIIWNQDWAGPQTIRYVDFGVDWYVRNVLPDYREAVLEWFDRHDEPGPHGSLRRDDGTFWQWGITPADMIGTMNVLGFHLDYFECHGPYSLATPLIHVDAYLFSRRVSPA
jgi:hypothetical protein